MVVRERHILCHALKLCPAHHYCHDCTGTHHHPTVNTHLKDMARSLSLLAEVAENLTHVARKGGIQPAYDYGTDDLVVLHAHVYHEFLPCSNKGPWLMVHAMLLTLSMTKNQPCQVVKAYLIHRSRDQKTMMVDHSWRLLWSPVTSH